MKRYLWLGLLAFLTACGGAVASPTAVTSTTNPAPTQTRAAELTQVAGVLSPSAVPSTRTPAPPTPTPTRPATTVNTGTFRTIARGGQTTAAAAAPPVVDGLITVLSNSYTVGEIAYTAAVVFRVRNPNTDVVANRVPYRVTISGGGQVLATSDGSHTVTIAPGHSRPVFFQQSNISTRAIKPETAEVQFYPGPSMFSRAADLSNQSQWAVTQNRIDCQGGTVQCKFVGDLLWRGDRPQTDVRVTIVIHQGSDVSGPILAAGSTSLSSGPLAPGQTAPLSVTLTGFDQPRPTGAAVPPEGPTTFEFYVESSTAR